MMYGSPPPAMASKGKEELLRGGGGGHHHQQQMSSGLLRFQSAPSSLLGELCEAENRFGRLLAHDPWDDKPSGADAAVDYQKAPQFRPLPPPPPEKVAFSSAPLMMYHHSQPQLQMPSLPMAAMHQIETAGSHHSSDLTRQSSSPAVFFSHLNVDNNYAAMRQMSFSSRQSSLMSQISEMASEEEEMAGRSRRSSPEESVGGGFLQGGGAPAWEEETSLLSGMKSRREESHQASSGLAHQLSLPKKSPDISAVEKFLQFQDAVPCRIRAKRGCATHPRSIAERVRRTKISQRMKKLQELVPNMDKQTNTADMLDLAVDYIKDLQEQVKLLTQSQGSCTCSSGKQKPYLHS